MPSEVRHYIKELENENQELRCFIPSFEKILEDLKRENQELKEEINRLEKRLRLYENPHTPPSKQRFKRGSGGKSSSGKCGAPKGHRGATRNIPKPDEIISVITDQCPNCGCNPGESKGFETITVEELPPPQRIKVTQYELYTYECQYCGLKFTSKHRDCPNKGYFGVNLLTYITMLKYQIRGVLRKIQAFLEYLCGFTISVTGIHDLLLRVGKACKNEYLKIRQCVRAAKWIYKDETGIRVNGKNWWLWIFRTDTGEVLVVIRDSRGRKVLEEILDGDFDIPGISDGWRAYTILSILQRCWAHLLRDVDEFKEKSAKGKELSEEIHLRFKKLKDFLGKDPPMDKRREQKIIWDKEISELVERYSQFDELHKPLTYIKNGLGCWYTCLLFPGMEPTNNLGEQAIRENVIMEKIIGAFRSISGAENYQYIASMFATWRIQGKNIFEELEMLLRRELCLS